MGRVTAFIVAVLWLLFSRLQASTFLDLSTSSGRLLAY